mgnify:CR=1 FL=1
MGSPYRMMEKRSVDTLTVREKVGNFLVQFSQKKSTPIALGVVITTGCIGFLEAVGYIITGLMVNDPKDMSILFRLIFGPIAAAGAVVIAIFFGYVGLFLIELVVRAGSVVTKRLEEYGKKIGPAHEDEETFWDGEDL